MNWCACDGWPDLKCSKFKPIEEWWAKPICVSTVSLSLSVWPTLTLSLLRGLLSSGHVSVPPDNCSLKNAAQLWGEDKKTGGEDGEFLGVKSHANALIAKACHPLTICINKYSVIMQRPCAWKITTVSGIIILPCSKLEMLREKDVLLTTIYNHSFISTVLMERLRTVAMF